MLPPPGMVPHPGMGGPPPPAHPGPPPVDPADLPPPGVPDGEKPGLPRPWDFTSRIPKQDVPKPDEGLVAALSQRARVRWRDRNLGLQPQHDVYYRRSTKLKLNGLDAVNPDEDEHVFVRSAPVRRMDRTISLIAPHMGAMRLQKRIRRKDDAGETAQKVENLIRAQWMADATDWDRERGPDGAPPLERQIAGQFAGQGGHGWMLRHNGDDSGSHPFTYVPIPVTELYPIDNWVLRITEVPFGDLRAAEPLVAKLFTPDEQDPGPAANTLCRLVSGASRNGQWHWQWWEFGSPVVTEAQVKAGKLKPEQQWLKKPTEINYPACLYQIEPYWNATALPALPNDIAGSGAQVSDQSDRTRNIARGIFASELDDITTMDRLLGITLTLAEKAVNPDTTDYILLEARGVDETGTLRVPGQYDGRAGARNVRVVGEKVEYGGQSPQGAQAIGAALSFLNSEAADAQPPAMSGLGRDASGFQSVVRQEAGETLHIEPLRRAIVAHFNRVDSMRLALMYQFGQGADKHWTKYFIDDDTADETVTAAEIALEGPVVEWSYRDENEPAKAAKQHRLLELHTAGLLPGSDVLDELGYEEPEVKHKLVLKEKLLKLPWVEQTLAFWEIAKRRNKSLTLIAWHALQNIPGGAPQMPGMPSQPGGGPGQGAPPPPQLAPQTGMPNPAAGSQMGQGGPMGGSQ